MNTPSYYPDGDPLVDDAVADMVVAGQQDDTTGDTLPTSARKWAKDWRVRALPNTKTGSLDELPQLLNALADENEVLQASLDASELLRNLEGERLRGQEQEPVVWEWQCDLHKDHRGLTYSNIYRDGKVNLCAHCFEEGYETEGSYTCKPYTRAHPDSSQGVSALVDRQAEDDGLWFPATTASEAYLQAALREIHKAVEGGLPGETK